MSRKIIYICVFILVVVLATGFYVYNRHATEQPTTVAATSTPSDLPRFIADNYGFAFSYSKDFEVLDMEDGHIIIQPISQGRDLEQAIVISSMVNDPPLSPSAWLNSTSSGYDMALGYKTQQVGGQEAVAVENGDWVVVNSPDDEAQISIALLGKDGPVPLKPELDTILGYFSFDVTLNSTTLQCPSYYLTKNLKLQSLLAFLPTLATTTANPKPDFVSARIDFYIDHNCTKDLTDYGYTGGTITPKIRQKLIDSMNKFIKEDNPTESN